MARRNRYGKNYAVRSKEGEFMVWTGVGRSLSQDRRIKAKRKVKSGYGHLGDL